jgi:hypothetical protein
LPPFAVHIYERASGPGDLPFETAAIGGPFDTPEDARAALKAVGWTAILDGWELPGRRLWAAEIVEMVPLP